MSSSLKILWWTFNANKSWKRIWKNHVQLQCMIRGCRLTGGQLNAGCWIINTYKNCLNKLIIAWFVRRIPTKLLQRLLLTNIELFFTFDKNLGRLWLAYTELQGDFYMLQLIYVDSRHFTQWYLSLGWSDLLEKKKFFFCISRSD